MTPEQGDRTEKATPKKRRDAREKGQVLKSTELNTALLILATFAFLSMIMGYLANRGITLMNMTLGNDAFAKVNPGMLDIGSSLLSALFFFALTVAPMFMVALVCGLIVNYIQVGFLFTTKPLMPKFSRINPLSGFKRMFSIRSAMEAFKAVAKAALIGLIGYGEISAHFDEMGLLMVTNIFAGLEKVMGIAVGIGLKVGMALVVLGVIDYIYQWFKNEKDLKMTKQEVKDEFKQQEGDPQVKGKIKQKQRQMAAMRMMQSVPDADVVVTNPTHYAVALKYDDGGGASAPVLLAKGKDRVAEKIKELAREHGVELYENREVAQALYFFCEIGDQIPEDMYQAVAEILAYVYKLKDEAGPFG